jgi:D-inositol-3-phosphate glycosyltransferase
MIQFAREKTGNSCLHQRYSEPGKTEGGGKIAQSTVVGPPSTVIGHPALSVALLTGGGDKSYVLGMAEAFTSKGLLLEVIGSDDLLCPELVNNPRVIFHNLRGDQRHDASFARKALRLTAYYIRLARYAATARPKIFHILWNNKFEVFDRTILMLYYRFLGKRIVFTAHNVNAGKRDSTDSNLNRLTLRIQYHLSDQILVHTKPMKTELVVDFGITKDKVSVIPFGINNTAPKTVLTSLEAKRRLGIDSNDKAALFFGQIAPYKGLEYLINAMGELTTKFPDFRLIIAGRPKIIAGAPDGGKNCWEQVQQAIARTGVCERIIQRIGFIPDEEVELYFKAADVLILPYTRIFQSGVLFLAYSFGLPVIAADVGSLKEDIVEGKTGLVFRAKDPVDLGKTIQAYFESEMFKDLENRRQGIRDYANERYSWSKVAAITTKVYSNLLGG